jgi:hypothetical protein
MNNFSQLIVLHPQNIIFLKLYTTNNQLIVTFKWKYD